MPSNVDYAAIEDLIALPQGGDVNPIVNEQAQGGPVGGDFDFPVNEQSPAAPQGGIDYAAIEKLLATRPDEPGAFDGVGRQLGLTGRALAQGVAGAVDIGYEPLAAIINWTLGENIGTLRGQVKQALTDIGVPESENAVERVIAAIGEGMTGAGAQAALARAATAPVRQAATTLAGILAAKPAQQVAGGAGASGATQLAAEAGAGTAVQLGAGLVGGLGAGRAFGLEARSLPSDLPQAIRDAEQAGVRVLTTDVRQPTTFAGRWLQRTGEMIPVVGTGPVRASQQTERIQAVKDMLQRYGVFDAPYAGDTTLARISTDLVGRRGEKITRYVNMKGQVIDRLAGKGVVDVSGAVGQIDTEIARLQRISPSGQFNPIIDRLTTWRSDLLGVRETVMPDGSIAEVAMGQPLDVIEILRKQIGKSFSTPDLASVRGEAEKVLSRIYRPLRDDMGNFVRDVGERRDYDKWNIGNKQLSKMAGELELGALKNALAKGEMTPETIRSLLFSSKPSDVKMLYRNLSSEGKKTAKMGVLQEALAKSGGDFENLSPDRFKQQLQKLSSPIGVLFSGAELKAAEALLRTLKMTVRAGQAAVSPPTGLQAVPVVGAAALADIFGGMGGALVSGATIGGIARAYESSAVRNLLLKIPQVVVGSAEEAELIKRVTAMIRAKVSVESQPENDEQRMTPATETPQGTQP